MYWSSYARFDMGCCGKNTRSPCTTPCDFFIMVALSSSYELLYEDIKGINFRNVIYNIYLMNHHMIPSSKNHSLTLVIFEKGENPVEIERVTFKHLHLLPNKVNKYVKVWGMYRHIYFTLSFG